MNSSIDAPSGLAHLYAEYWRFAAGRRVRMVLAYTLLGGSQVVKLALPWLAAQAINTLQIDGAAGLERAGLWVLAILAVAGLTWALHGPGRVLERAVAVRVRESVSDRLYARLAALPLAWHHGRHSGDTVQRVKQTSGALFEFAQSQYIYLQALVNIAGPVVALGLLSLPLGAGALGGLALIAAVVVRFDQALMRLGARENAAERGYAAGVADYLANIATILSLRLQAATRRLIARRLDAVFEPLRRTIVLNEWKWCGVDLLSLALTWGLVGAYVAVGRRSGAPLLVGDLFMVYQYAQQASGVLGAIAMHYQQLARIRVDYGAAAPIWGAAPREAPAPIASDWQRIELEDVRLRYTRRADDPPALAGVNLTLHRGERIALVGATGAGKSALLRVLGGLFDAESGGFRVDGVARPELRHLGAIATLVPQETEAFNGTLRDNLDLGAGFADEELERAAQLAAFDGIVARLGAGLDTPLAERGSNLSGGERQRLALARGILAAAPSSLVLLDEPTSSLDPVTEARVVSAFASAFPGACVVASVHRMGLLALFDRVVVMERGRVLATGSIEELLASTPAFCAMWTRSGVTDRSSSARAPAGQAA